MLESFRGDPRFAALTLGPLTPSEHRALVELSAGGGKLSDDLAGRLLAATEGNPLFTRRSSSARSSTSAGSRGTTREP